MEIEDTEYQKIVSEISETLDLACIKESELNNLTQTLYYIPDESASESIKLLELDEHLVEAITKGETLSFQGNKQESAVLCSASRTYEIRGAETSNSCLLVPQLKLSGQTKNLENDRPVEKRTISGIFHTYYEVRECKPKLEKLITLLEPSSYKGKEYESSIDPDTLYDWYRLVSEVQASEAELKQALNEYLVANIDGKLRLVSFECEARTVTFMLDVFDANSWELDEVDKELTFETIEELVPKPIFELLFEKYTVPSNKKKDDGRVLYCYQEDLCCKMLAKVLFVASPVTEFKQFMESWSIGSPEKMQPKEEYLSGIALISWNNTTRRKEVISFPEADLPNGLNERLNELFKAKDKWTVDEITPYISKLTTSTMNVNALLTKYARCSTVNGIKYYSSKHGK